MAGTVTEIMNLVRNVCEEENLRVTIKGSLKNGLAAGVGGAIGCILGGPWGGVPGKSSVAAASQDVYIYAFIGSGYKSFVVAVMTVFCYFYEYPLPL